MHIICIYICVCVCVCIYVYACTRSYVNTYVKASSVVYRMLNPLKLSDFVIIILGEKFEQFAHKASPSLTLRIFSFPLQM